MGKFRRIMVVVDPAMQRSTAFRRGVALAKRSGAELVLLLVTYHAAILRPRLVDPGLTERAIDGYLAARRRWLDSEAEALRREGLASVSTRAVWHKRAHVAIAREALELAPDLVIRDIQPSSALQRAVFTPADWHVLRLCPAPLMLVDEDAGSYPQRILAAVDILDSNDKPGELNDEIVTQALHMAAVCDASVHLVHASNVSPALALGESVMIDPALGEELRERSREELAAFAAKHGIPAERRHLLEGHPSQVIPALARELNVDLTVLGTVQRGTLRRAIMGATAEEILHELDCDVLVLKPPGFAAALDPELLEDD